jgi:phosphohistidine swiveling domain-containing protein
VDEKAIREISAVISDEKNIKAMAAVIAKGDRIELVPQPNNGVKILHTRRKVVKMEQ